MILTGLFFTSLAAATLFPGASEAYLLAILAKSEISANLAIGIATAGNTIGSIINWAIGRFFSHYRDHRWFPISREKYVRYSNWFQRWGLWSLLLSWMPFIGDPITVIAGIARTSLWLFVPIVLVAKLVRYLVVAGVFNLVW